MDPEVANARIRWRAAERRLYPLALTDTDAYKDVVEAVGRVIGELRRRDATMRDLLSAESDPSLLSLAEAEPRGLLAVDRVSVVAAACALHSVQLGAGR